jgi:gas vesicle protein GvpL/GvpF
MPTMAETLRQGRYLFAVARGLEAGALTTAAGLRGAPLEVVEHRDLQAVVCSVDLEEFGEEALPRNLEDLAWLEDVARCHHEVVFAAASTGTVAPMRLVTICADDNSVRDRIESVYDELSRALSRVEGSSEWSLKVYAPRREPETVGERPTSGAAYLQRKRDQAQQRRSAGAQSQQRAEDIDRTLGGHVVASRLLAPQDPRLTGRSETMILNGAYLVSDADSDGFRSVVARLTEVNPDLVLELKGPWPPYSFATLE